MVLDLIREKLAECYREMKQVSFASIQPKRVSVQVPKCSLLGMLAAQSTNPSVYWKTRESSFEILGFGVADAVELHGNLECVLGFSELEQKLSRLPQTAAYYGGMAFSWDERWERSVWAGVPSFKFVLPLVEICRMGLIFELRCWVFPTATRSLEEAIEQINVTLDQIKWVADPPEFFDESLSLVSVVPAYSKWLQMVDRVQTDIRTGAVQKEVLSGCWEFHHSYSLHAGRILARLLNEDAVAESQRFGFLFQFGHKVFVGASPELLFCREEFKIKSEAVAGTRPRGNSEEEDLLLEQALFHEKKDTDEHSWVVRHIEEALRPMCGVWIESGTSVMKAGHVQHRYQQFEGTLKMGYSDQELVKALHPTPAVSGYPVQGAVQRLQQTEPSVRGWYTGIVGQISLEKTTFSVAIRSALVSENRCWAFAGAGIVAGSDAHAEWQELLLKIDPFLTGFDND